MFGNDIAVDEIGNAYFIGFTIPTFPIEPSLEVSQVDNVDTTNDVFVAKLATNNPSPVIPSPNTFESFDENLYLIENPGVAAAVINNVLESGFEHWLEFGFLEGRSPQFAFDEKFYLNSNPGVLEAVRNGTFINGLEHFVRFGEAEGRSPIG